jgi:C_GCAxxG_C_C family probable redox protein
VSEHAGKVARAFFEQNYNCAEAVWLGLNQDLSKEEQAFGLKLASGFGGGAACGSICGAVAGAILAIGRWYGRELGGPRSDDAKSLTLELVEAFKQEFGSLDCRDIKPQEDNYRVKCAEYVDFCARVTEELLDRGPGGDCG